MAVWEPHSVSTDATRSGSLRSLMSKTCRPSHPREHPGRHRLPVTGRPGRRGRVPGANQDIAQHDDVALVAGTVAVVQQLHRVVWFADVDDPEPVVVALEGEPAPKARSELAVKGEMVLARGERPSGCMFLL